jgi:hypothetical protein
MIAEFFIDHWQVITFIMALLFNAGVMYKTFRDKPSVKIVAEMIDKAFIGHCPFESRLVRLEVWKEELVRDNVIVARTLVKETEQAHLAAQRIELNLKKVCEKLGITYN